MRFPSNQAQHSPAHRAEKHAISELKLQGHGTGRKKQFQLIWWMQGNYSFPKPAPLPVLWVETSHFFFPEIAGKRETKLQVEARGNRRHSRDLAITPRALDSLFSS